MGWSVKKILPSKVNRAIDKAGGGTKLLAQVAPVYSVFTSGGRQELMKNYGGVAQGIVGMYGGQQAQGFFSQVVDRVTGPTTGPQAEADTGGGGGGGGGFFSGGPSAAGAPGMTGWLWPVAAVVGVIVLVVFMLNRRR